MLYEVITHALSVVRLGETHYQVPEPGIPRHVDAHSAAVEVMTDLHRVPAATIPPSMAVDQVQQAMVLRGVRMLLVVDTHRTVKGLVTTHDLLGEHPVAVAQARGIKLAELRITSYNVCYTKLLRMPRTAGAPPRLSGSITRACWRPMLRSASTTSPTLALSTSRRVT